MPKSPRATITESETSQISSIFDNPSLSSIFEIIFTVLVLFLRISFKSSISEAFLTKDKAMKSTSSFIPNAMSLLSFSVTEGKLIRIPGKLTCLLLPSFPPSRTLHSSSFLDFFSTLKFSSPLSKLISVPTFTL